MSKFDKKALENLQDLCKIKLKEKEIAKFAEDLKKIIDYVELLNEVDTKNIETCNYVLMDFQKNVFREDEVKNTLDKDRFLANAPDQIASMIKVPQILSKK